MHQLRLFFVALQFFTRLPIPPWVGFQPDWLHHSSRYFPLVGCVVAAVAATVYALTAVVLPAPVAAVLSTVASIYATGAFHEDGFADTCDGFGGGLTPERVLEIMKDSRVGAYGAIGIACILGLKCTALAMLSPTGAIAALFVAHPLSRLAATSLIWRMEYARNEGKSKPMAQSMTGREFSIATVSACLPAVFIVALGLLTPTVVLACVLIAALAALWLALKFKARINGYTGDCLGAVQQVAEVAIYLVIVASLGHGGFA